MARQRDPENLEAQVAAALAGDVLIDESQIEVEVASGVVTLVGTVGSLPEKLIAQRVARRVDGVHDLVNAIDVRPLGDKRPSDAELKAMVERVLAWDALVSEQHLVVSVTDGLVALTGWCQTNAQAAEAERAAGHLYGVRDVLNRIDVASPFPTPTDVRTVILDALGRRLAHGASRIDIVVDGSMVTLRGAVQSPAERVAIVGAVGHAPGISEVRDELWIEPERTPRPRDAR